LFFGHNLFSRWARFGAFVIPTVSKLSDCYPIVKHFFTLDYIFYLEKGMNMFVSKEIRLNIRIKPELKADLESVADFYGLTVTSYVHSVLIRKMREEKEREPEAFQLKAKGTSTANLNLSNTQKIPVLDSTGNAKE
jgi:hypothetical protein